MLYAFPEYGVVKYFPIVGLRQSNGTFLKEKKRVTYEVSHLG